MTLLRNFTSLVLLWCACVQVSAQPSLPPVAQLEHDGARIGNITIERRDIFDPSVEAESGRFHRIVNRLHIVTDEELIRAQLLFKHGDPLTVQSIKETERLLRQNKYLYEAQIEIVAYDRGVADIKVTTKDLWTLSPELDWSRSGGNNYFTIGIEDDNFLGTGASVTLSREESIDRTSNLFLYSNKNLANTRAVLDLGISDSNDGGAYSLGLRRPFFSLDTRWAAGLRFDSFDGEESFYRNGIDTADYLRDSTSFSLERGWSNGRQSRWIRRVNLGLAGERSDFLPTQNLARTVAVPANREYYYPYVSLHILEDRFVTVRNFKTIDRLEDVYLGTQFQALLGYASESFGSARDALFLSTSVSHNIGSPDHSLLSISFNTASRLESASLNNLSSQLDMKWSHKSGDRWQFYSALDLQHRERPDLDNLTLLGGTTGLRGYPTRYRTGHGRALLTVEQRYFSKWYPWRLFRLGAAVFFDAGQVWGRNAFGETNDDFLIDTGIGLRLGSTKGGSKKVIHIDLAFPLNDDAAIDNVQLLIEAKQGF